MKQSLSKHQSGFGTVGIVLAVVGVALVVGIGWFITQSSKKDTNTSTLPSAIKNAQCDYNDKNLCTFFAGHKISKSYAVEYTAGTGAEQTVTTVKSESPTKFSMSITGTTNYETITINNAYYVKATSGTWWKQTIPEGDASLYGPHLNDKLTEPGTQELSADNTYYESQGKEQCGDSLACFKYQVIDPKDTASKAHIWFDDKEYKLRRMQNTGTANPFNATYTYNKVTITAPTPVQDLAPGQFLAPGQSQPTDGQSQQPPKLPDDYQYE